MYCLVPPIKEPPEGETIHTLYTHHSCLIIPSQAAGAVVGAENAFKLNNSSVVIIPHMMSILIKSLIQVDLMSCVKIWQS